MTSQENGRAEIVAWLGTAREALAVACSPRLRAGAMQFLNAIAARVRKPSASVFMTHRQIADQAFRSISWSKRNARLACELGLIDVVDVSRRSRRIAELPKARGLLVTLKVKAPKDGDA